VRRTLAAKSTKFLQFQAFRFLFFVLGAVVINAIALGALKLDCLAHIYFYFLRSPADALTESQKIMIYF
jgi:hypothetical protein